MGLRYLLRGRFGDGQCPGVLLGIPNNPKFFSSFCGVGSPVQISAGGEKLVWFVHHILLYLNCYCARLKPQWFSIYIVFMLYLYYKVY